MVYKLHGKLLSLSSLANLTFYYKSRFDTLKTEMTKKDMLDNIPDKTYIIDMLLFICVKYSLDFKQNTYFTKNV